MNKLRILLGDDHLLLRHGLRRILQERPDWEVVGEASDGREAVALALETRPDIAIFDIGMPLLNGVDATAQLVRRLRDLRVLILSLHATEGDIVKALKAGAKGYLSKEVADVELIRAVEALRDGKSYFSPAASKVILDDYVKHLGEQNVTDRYAKPTPKTDIVRVMIRVLNADKKRVALPVLVTAKEPKTELKGMSKDEKADTNDFLTFELPRGKEFVIRVGEVEKTIKTPANGEQAVVEFVSK